jgi:hypothetical protein
MYIFVFHIWVLTQAQAQLYCNVYKATILSTNVAVFEGSYCPKQRHLWRAFVESYRQKFWRSFEKELVLYILTLCVVTLFSADGAGYKVRCIFVTTRARYNYTGDTGGSVSETSLIPYRQVPPKRPYYPAKRVLRNVVSDLLAGTSDMWLVTC